jgi:hypothetical protein
MKRLLACALVLVSSLSVQVPAAVPAFASQAQCDTYPNLCIWRQAGYSSYFGKWNGSVSNLSTYPRPGCVYGNWNDCNGSGWNSSSACFCQHYKLFKDAGYNGGSYIEDYFMDYAQTASSFPSNISAQMTSFQLLIY